MKIQINKFNFASVGLGLLVFTLTFLYANGLIFSLESILNKVFSTKGETTAVQSINTVRTLQAQYASKHQGQYAPNFDELIKSMQLKDDFKGENPVIGEYVYKMTVRESSRTTPAFYSISADPQNRERRRFNKTLHIFFSSIQRINLFQRPRPDNTRHFYFDSTLGSIKCTEEDRPARADDTSI